MPFAEANGQRLFYRAHGKGEPLLLVMGLGADNVAWALQLRAWTSRYRTVIFDNRDVGRSSHADGPYKIADMAVDTLGLADELGLDRFHLLGFSMGGTIAQELTLAAPDRVKTLTLCVTWGGWDDDEREKARARLSPVPGLSYEQRTETMLRIVLSDEFQRDTERFEYVKRMSLANPHPQPPEAFARQAEACTRHEARDRLPGLDMPVHVIGAESDRLVPCSKSKEIAELVPGARLTMLEGAPHAVNIDGAEHFNAAVLDFLSSAAGREAAAG